MYLQIDKRQLAKLNQDNLKETIALLKSGKYPKHQSRMVKLDEHKDVIAACCLGVVALEIDKTILGNLYRRGLPGKDSPFSNELHTKIKVKCKNHASIMLYQLNDGIHILDETVCLSHPDIAKLLEGKRLNTNTITMDNAVYETNS